ncbi:MAG: hypothetical protein N2508_12315, partial [Anaerolineae bacterium]|nr:hypothetical protein [Anaerolineae bacterium]
MNQRLYYPRLMLALIAGMGTFVALILALSLPLRAAPARQDFPAGATLIPLGAGQPDDLSRRNAYKALWHALYEGPPPLAWTAVTVTV